MSLISPTSVGIIPYRQDLKQDGVKVCTLGLLSHLLIIYIGINSKAVVR
jgi:putative effector of murein hydrolase LrgA (UPF0299 family)